MSWHDPDPHPTRYDEAVATNVDMADNHERVHYSGFRMLWGVLAAALILAGITLLSRSNPDIERYRLEHPPQSSRF